MQLAVELTWPRADTEPCFRDHEVAYLLLLQCVMNMVSTCPERGKLLSDILSVRQQTFPKPLGCDGMTDHGKRASLSGVMFKACSRSPPHSSARTDPRSSRFRTPGPCAWRVLRPRALVVGQIVYMTCVASEASRQSGTSMSAKSSPRFCFNWFRRACEVKGRAVPPPALLRLKSFVDDEQCFGECHNMAVIRLTSRLLDDPA